VRLTTLPPSISRLSKQCVSLHLLQPYGPAWPVTWIALLNFFTDMGREGTEIGALSEPIGIGGTARRATFLQESEWEK
jgi:hypothetical protein